MKILLVVDSLTFGGAESQVILLARSFIDLGHEVRVYSLSANVPRRSELDKLSIPLFLGHKKNLFDLRIITDLRRIIVDWPADIVHSFLFRADFYSRLATLWSGIPLINSERSSDYQYDLKRFLLQTVTSFIPSAVVANTFAGSHFARKNYILPRSRFHVVWNGIDLDLLRQKVHICKKNYRYDFFGTNRSKVACMVANIKPSKDYLFALKVANYLISNNESWRVVFIGHLPLEGDRDYYDRVKDLYNKQSNRKKVIFVGHRPDTVEIMGQSDIVFLTSRYEGFPNVILEAMAANTPVVSTKVSDLEKILPLPSQVVSQRDPEYFVQSLLSVYKSKDKCLEKQKLWLEENGAILKTAGKMIDIYTETIRQNKRNKANFSHPANIKN